MDILFQDASLLVCIKPAGVLSTDEPGGLPALVRQALGDPAADVRTVHRLDRSSAVRSGRARLKRNISPSSTAKRRNGVNCGIFSGATGRGK